MKTKETNPAKEVLDKLVAAGMGLYEISMASGVGGASVYNCYTRGADMTSANVRKLELLLFKKEYSDGRIDPRWLWPGNVFELDGKEQTIAGVSPCLFNSGDYYISVWTVSEGGMKEPRRLTPDEVSRIKFLKP